VGVIRFERGLPTKWTASRPSTQRAAQWKAGGSRSHEIWMGCCRSLDRNVARVLEARAANCLGYNVRGFGCVDDAIGDTQGLDGSRQGIHAVPGLEVSKEGQAMTDERIRQLAEEAITGMKLKVPLNDRAIVTRGRIEQAIREAIAEERETIIEIVSD